MKTYCSHIRIVILLLILCLWLPACGSAGDSTSDSDIVLSLYNSSGPAYLTMDDLKALPVTEGMGGLISSTGEISIPDSYRGVALKDLAMAFGGTFDSSMGVTLTAEDGYSMTFSFEQVMNGDFVAYDPAMGNELPGHDPLTAILAYERNGQPLDPVEDGRLRLMVVSEKNNQVVDGHWTVKWINKMEVEQISAEWELDLRGAIITPVDRGSFQSCGSPGCHGVEWQDENGQTWEGIPLWVLVGQVDDGDTHSDFAFNDELADSGYTVDIVGGDGVSLSFDSSAIRRNSDILIAHMVNGAELPGKYYPLRLVGSELENEQMLGQITSVMVNVPELSTVTPVPVDDVTGDLVIVGLVENPQGFEDQELRASEEVVEKTLEHYQGGPQVYTGLRFECLFQMTGLEDGATTVVLTAADGYSAEINLAELETCSDCMVAFTDMPGVYDAIMPGFLSSAWVNNLAVIEVK